MGGSNLAQVLDVNRGRHKALGAPVGVPTDAQRKGNAHLASLPDLLADLAPRYMHAMSEALHLRLSCLAPALVLPVLFAFRRCLLPVV